MMQRGVIASVVFLVAFSIGAVAVEWEEVNWGTEVVLDSDTGLPAIVFYAAVEYSESPDSYYLEGGWEVYAIVNGAQVPIEAAPTTARLRGSTLTIYSATSQIPVEAGKMYGARLSLQDTVNELTYERTFATALSRYSQWASRSAAGMVLTILTSAHCRTRSWKNSPFSTPSWRAGSSLVFQHSVLDRLSLQWQPSLVATA